MLVFTLGMQPTTDYKVNFKPFKEYTKPFRVNTSGYPIKQKFAQSNKNISAKNQIVTLKSSGIHFEQEDFSKVEFVSLLNMHLFMCNFVHVLKNR